MVRYDNQHEKLMARSLEQEEVTFESVARVDDSDETDVVCLDCNAKFSAVDPDECEVCGSADLDVA